MKSIRFNGYYYYRIEFGMMVLNAHANDHTWAMDIPVASPPEFSKPHAQTTFHADLHILKDFWGKELSQICTHMHKHTHAYTHMYTTHHIHKHTCTRIKLNANVLIVHVTCVTPSCDTYCVVM